jgi:WD40 repeat protein
VAVSGWEVSPATISRLLEIFRFLKNLSNHNSVLNSLAINEDGVLVSGGDDGTLNFWDYDSGYCFQKTQTIVQPGDQRERFF